MGEGAPRRPHSARACCAVRHTGLPQMARAIQRHCQELPWLQDGLSLTERLVMQLLAEEPRTAGEIYSALMREREPLPWLGDIMLLFILNSMRAATKPMFTGTFKGEQRQWLDELLTITDLGRAVLAGEVDWLSLSPPERWLGGVRVSAASPCWRWDEQAATTGHAMSPGERADEVRSPSSRWMRSYGCGCTMRDLAGAVPTFAHPEAVTAGMVPDLPGTCVRPSHRPRFGAAAGPGIHTVLRRRHERRGEALHGRD